MKRLVALLINFFVFVSIGISAAPPVGQASFYGYELDGRLMANGKPFDPSARTCASWFYRLGTTLRVTNISTGQSVCVTVTDRGPAKRLVKQGRIIDLSLAAFSVIGLPKHGLISVQIDKL